MCRGIGRLLFLCGCLVGICGSWVSAVNLPLHDAVLKGDVILLKQLLDSKTGGDIDAQDHEGDTALYRAVQVGNREMVLLLICAGALVDLANQHDCTPLHRAARAGNVEIVALLLAAGASLAARNKFLDTPLHFAAKCSDDIRVLDKKTEQQNAAEKLAVVQLLLLCGANPTLKNNNNPPECAADIAMTDEIKNALMGIKAVPNLRVPSRFERYRPYICNPYVYTVAGVGFLVVAILGVRRLRANGLPKWFRGLRSTVNRTNMPALKLSLNQENSNFIPRFSAVLPKVS
ncbi:TPA: hypothetical protein DDZ86_05265 [Candidatus Dependentiae bacterium]|nr:hypothetical protein [Candidatus Dependentiae bacterium]